MSHISADFMSTPFIRRRTHVSNCWTEHRISGGGTGRHAANDAGVPQASIGGEGRGEKEKEEMV
jgi:hypothetical protein